MSEELRKMSAFDAFKQTQQTFVEAEEKAKLEAGTPRVPRFRIGEDGEYSIRILPLAPSFDEDGNILPMERKGYEHPLHQFFLSIKTPTKKGAKAKTINIPVINATDKGVGHSIDLIDTYVKIAKEMYADDEEIIKLIGESGFSKGLRWTYQHAMMVLDVSSDKERAKGPQIWQCSHSQYKSIDEAKMRLWRELREDDEQEGCPISSLTGAYPVKVIRSNNNGKTDYTFEIGRKKLDVREEEAEKLLELPRIPEQIYRYTRYQFEATQVFLKQYDEEHGMEVCSEPDFQDAVAKLAGELSADDTSHFDLAGAVKAKESDVVTIDSLWEDCNYIADQDLSERSEEYQELREKIRQFIEDNNLDVRISRSKNNQQMLEEVEEALEQAKSEKPAPKAEPKPEPKKRTVKKAAPEPEPESEEEEVEEIEEVEDEVEEEPAPAPKRRSPRPGSTAAAEKEEPAEEEPAEEPAPAAVPRRPRRLR